MVSLETLQATSKSIEPSSSPARISFSSEFLDESNFISICPNPNAERERERARAPRNPEFEFLSGSNSTPNMITADELFSEGKLLPFWQMQHIEKLNKITLKMESNDEPARPDETGPNKPEENRISWFLDDDPSPRPPKCTVLWKELLRLKKHRASTLSPSSSSSSSSRSSITEIPSGDERKEGSKEKAVKRIKKGLERTRSASIRIRPVINVPICTQVKSSSLPPLFSLRKGR
ncbi:hypothetical protein BUALT_Bualt14G0090600 [Buddleja alternifolia]|uniref:Uncharacterized protein n=1 Tax=Buddleja alternifolia TaxID=168488 RepID=A0AAV6WP45_9LAMI|nr:hypothetical protein BUALT_Bualt14G0090600 [Buddleja alternifolia]